MNFPGGTLLFLLLLPNLSFSQTIYEPTWESLDTRPMPTWFDEAKIGIYIHWGVYSVPSFGNERFMRYWKENQTKYVEFMADNYPPNFSYPEFASQMTAEFFNSAQWAEIIKSSGARYVVIASKHDDGFSLWPSTYSPNWNSMDVGPKRDILGELSSAVKSQGIRFGVQYFLSEYSNRLYLNDEASGFQTNNYVRERTSPELIELVESYQPDFIIPYEYYGATSNYWNSTGFLAWLYNESPNRNEVIVTDNWGTDVHCKHNGMITCKGRGQKWHILEALYTSGYGYRREAALSDYNDIHTIIQVVAETVSQGGNIEINIAPSKDGKIPPIQEERVRQLGEWLSINGEAIYKTQPWDVPSDNLTSGVWYTQDSSGDYVYAIVLDWPKNSVLTLGITFDLNFATTSLLGYSGGLQYIFHDDHVEVIFPQMADVSSKWAWVVKLGKKSD